MLIAFFLTLLIYIDLIAFCCGEKAPMAKCLIDICKDILCKCKLLELIKNEDCYIVLKKICLYFTIIYFLFYHIYLD